ncbi:MAG: DUF655 domain-containing protein [Thermoprotei archaeon]|nr:MAG: DUF655 domain-containing protein [Thermoprotei archaeon]
MYRRSGRPRRYFRERGFREEHKEQSVYVLDYLPFGNPLDKYREYRNRPVAQVIGTKYFTLLEVEPYPGIDLEVGERVDISPESKIRRIIGRISYNDLTSNARGNLEDIVRKIVLENERIFVEFFNKAGPINIRLHSLELLPGVGKKTMKLILEERKKKRFESFNEIQERVKLSDPAKTIVDRVIVELRGEDKYYLFVKPPRFVLESGAVYLGYLEKLHYL